MMLAARLRRKLTGGSTALDTQTVTTGTIGTAPERGRGFLSGFYGSVADATSNIYGGAAVTAFYYNENGGAGQTYVLTITGATNSGWTQVTIDGLKTLTRISAASFSAGTWTWTTTDIMGTQAFGANASAHTCVFS